VLDLEQERTIRPAVSFALAPAQLPGYHEVAFAMSLPPVVARCDACGQNYGVLTAVRHEITTFRCASCGDVSWSDMPTLDKKVLYLDQNAISEIFKVRTGTMRADAKHRSYWQEVSDLLEKAVLLQQVICPASDIHRDESILFARGGELSLAHEMLGGDASFESCHEIEAAQLWGHLKAFDTGADPSVSLSVDDILHGTRNEWLPKLHISAQMDWSAIAREVRASRDASPSQYAPLYERWRTDPKVSFASVLDEELKGFGTARATAYRHFAEAAKRGMEQNDLQGFMNAALSGPVLEFKELRDHFQRTGLSLQEAEQRVVEFWMWPGNWTIPHHRIQAYLFAAMARKIVNGQKKDPTRGASNDIRAIATYAPYVDAMFIDSEFANFLQEQPLKTDLKYRARIFSLRSREAFQEYLREIIARPPIEVEMVAVALYGDGARRA
jgi:hypothetical protein